MKIQCIFYVSILLFIFQCAIQVMINVYSILQKYLEMNVQFLGLNLFYQYPEQYIFSINLNFPLADQQRLMLHNKNLDCSNATLVRWNLILNDFYSSVTRGRGFIVVFEWIEGEIISLENLSEKNNMQLFTGFTALRTHQIKQALLDPRDSPQWPFFQLLLPSAFFLFGCICMLLV